LYPRFALLAEANLGRNTLKRAEVEFRHRALVHCSGMIPRVEPEACFRKNRFALFRIMH